MGTRIKGYIERKFGTHLTAPRGGLKQRDGATEAREATEPGPDKKSAKQSLPTPLRIPVAGVRGVGRGVLAVLRWIWRVLNGIQFKLAVFTGSLIALTIVILSTSYVYQQTEILTESYEREAAISRNYISSL
ncbi:hypothetical protein ACQV5M_22575, partial [Leptospira sp. SA-E8]